MRVLFLSGGKAPIAHSPGLYLDPISHRWKRIDHDESEPGIGRWNARMNQREREAMAARNRVLDHHAAGVIEFAHERGDGRHAAVMRDASEPGRWRLTRFDDDGFAGHSTHDTHHAALAEAASSGYTQPAAGSLDRMSSTERWAQGTRDGRVMQTINHLGGSGHSELASAVGDYYHRNGRSAAAHDAIHQRDTLAQLHAGSLPEALKAQIGLFSDDPSHGGRLTQEDRADRTGRRQRRWVLASKPAEKPQTIGRDPDDHRTVDLEDMIAWSAGHASRHGIHRDWSGGPTVGEQMGLFAEVERRGFDRGNYFPSGSHHPGEIRGFADAGWNVGFSVNHLTEPAIREVAKLHGRGTKVFADSGAFSEVSFAGGTPKVVQPITDEEWRRRLGIYARIAWHIGPQAYVVAPDMVGHQPETLDRLRRYAREMQDIRELGANILVPLQKGEMNLAEFDDAATRAIGFSDYIRAIPMKKDATSIAELEAYVREKRPPRIHLLGIGVDSPRAPAVSAMLARVSPGTEVFLDSVKIRAHVGRPEGRPARPLTAAQDAVAAELHEVAFSDASPEETPLWSEARAWPEEYTTHAERKGIADALRLDPELREAWLDHPTRFLSQPIDPTIDPRKLTMKQLSGPNPVFWDDHPMMERLLREAWRRWFTSRGTTPYRKAEAIRRLWGLDRRQEAAKAEQLGLFGDMTHGGQLHPEVRVDRTGRTQRRWLHSQFGEAGAPKPGERGYRELSPERAAAERRASVIYSAAEGLIQSELGQHVYEQMRRAWGIPGDDDFADVIEPEDLPDLIDWPQADPATAADLIEMVMASSDPVGHGPPRAIAEAIIADQIAPAGKLRLVNVRPDEAMAFIAEHHSTMPVGNPRGLMYAIGVKHGGRLVAVATAGTPTGRWSNPHAVLELTRIASDGTVKGASSKLAARLLDLAPRSVRNAPPGSPWLFVTYSLASERGTTYKALREKGLRPTELIKGKSAGGGGARSGSTTGYAADDKIRWEAGPLASPAKWSLVE